MRTRLMISFVALFAVSVFVTARAQTSSIRASVSNKEMSQALDKDTLDMAGDWRLTYGYNIGFPLASPRTYGVRFEITGPGKHGGVKFKGHYTDPPGQQGSFEGETFYNGRGVQIVQMLVHYDPLRYLEVLCGKHQKDPKNPAKVWILGGWGNVGNAAGGAPGGGSGYLANFEMVKVIPRK